MVSSASISEIAKALNKLQGQLKPAPKDTLNKFFGNKYADLAGIWENIRKPLSDNGLSVIQQPGADGEFITLTTILMHISGEWVESTAKAIPQKRDPQGAGSCISYLRRYSLSAFLGVSTDDDDGNAASQTKPSYGVQNAAKSPPIHPSDSEVQDMDSHVRDIAKEEPNAEVEKMRVLNILIGKGGKFEGKVGPAKKYMEEWVKTDFKDITAKHCEMMVRQLGSK